MLANTSGNSTISTILDDPATIALPSSVRNKEKKIPQKIKTKQKQTNNILRNIEGNCTCVSLS